jgi:RNA polymerase sigma-70 factor (ECF subfamily)
MLAARAACVGAWPMLAMAAAVDPVKTNPPAIAAVRRRIFFVGIAAPTRCRRRRRYERSARGWLGDAETGMASFGAAICPSLVCGSYDAALTGPGGLSVRSVGMFFPSRSLILRIWAGRSRRSEPIGWGIRRTWQGGGNAVSWSDSGARTGPHEIGLIANIAAKNDDDAARKIYRKYRMELFRFGFHVLRDQGLAEEMVQETFIKFCQQARNYNASRGSVRGWLFTMARSVAYDIARRPSSRPFLPVEDFQLPAQYDSVDEALTVLTVDQALDKLPSIYSDVMRLVRDGFTHSEIAGRLGIPIGTVKSRLAKAADTLRSELASLRGAADAY